MPTKLSVASHVDPIVKRYYPELLPSLHACLAVCGAMCFSGRTRPLSLILEGASGSGKSTVLQMLFPLKDSGLEQYVYRTDNFTPKAFVSHAANVSSKKRAALDLLPRIKDKIMVTKELSPIFRGKVEDMRALFAIIIPVLDGQGLTTDSGMQGQKGYTEQHLFNWLGATTPFPTETHRLMSQLGTRLLFYEVPSLDLTEAELVEFAEREDAGEAESECRASVNQFLLQLFKQNPVGSLDPKSISIPKDAAKSLARLAILLTKGRTEVRLEKDNDGETQFKVSSPEAPFKVVHYLKDLARGHALIHGRSSVNDDDLQLLQHVTVSSIPSHLRAPLRALAEKGRLNTFDCKKRCNVSSPTARKYLEELTVLGITTLVKGSPKSNGKDTAVLTPDFNWWHSTTNLES